MPVARFHIPHPRPTKLLDPFFDNTPEHLDKVLSKPDDQLNTVDFQCILGPFLPAGTYVEAVYFLPLAFDFIQQHDESALELIPSLAWFASEYANNLRQDGVLDQTRSSLHGCFDLWLSEFRVIHFDRSACVSKGWSREYFDHVHRSDIVAEGLNVLVQFKRHADLAEAVVTELVDHLSDPIKAAWFLELSRRQTDVHHPPRKNKRINALLNDSSLLQSAASTVCDHLLAKESSPTYWSDTLLTLGLL